MKNRWDEKQAARSAASAQNDADVDLAMRVYSSRLIGQDPDLVLHGGGNTSVKTKREVDGGEVQVIHVKGSGWDLDTIEGPGLPALLLKPLLSARNWGPMSDQEMVQFLRNNLLDPSAPNPSVETLLHAFLPAKFVDHTHASAVLALANQPNSADIARQIYGDRIAVVPYVMPGYDLSIEGARVFDQFPECEGLWLDNHGLFTFGATARQSYDRMIAMVELASRHLEEKGVALPQELPSRNSTVEVEALRERLDSILRKEGPPFADGATFDFRADANIDRYVTHDHLQDLSRRGTLTPDHVIRIKPFPFICELDDDEAKLASALFDYVDRYRSYFARNEPKSAERKVMLDPLPRVVLVRGCGLFGVGRSAKEAGIAADLAVQTARVVPLAEAYGRFQPISENDLFEMEYWSLEQAKLRK